MVKKEIIILGDIEMGGGTLTDDFISDRTLSELIRFLTRKKHPVDLVLNGDTLDFLKCPYIKNGKKKYTRHVTAEISRTKLKLIYNAHQQVFDALKNFVQKKKNHLYFIIGNHDQDLFFKSVRYELRKILQAKSNVSFTLKYQKHQVYVEHGQQYDLFNKVNQKHLFLQYKGNPILNIPWTSFGIISNFLTLKEEHPFLERIKPHPVLFKYHESILKKLKMKSVDYVLKSIFYFPIRYYFDPTYAFPRMLFGELYYRFKNRNFDVDQIVDLFKRKNRRIIRQNKLYVLGHIHENYLEEREGWAIIHPDTWRDEYIMDNKTKELSSKPKKYVKVIVNKDNEIYWNIEECPRKRSTLLFSDVTKEEKKFLKLAAKEEGFKLPALKTF